MSDWERERRIEHVNEIAWQKRHRHQVGIPYRVPWVIESRDADCHQHIRAIIREDTPAKVPEEASE